MMLRFRLGPTLIFRLRARAILLKWQLSFVGRSPAVYVMVWDIFGLTRHFRHSFETDRLAASFSPPWDPANKETLRLNGTSMLNNETEWYVHAEQRD